MATKTGPDEKLMENSRLSLTLIGYGSTSVKHSLDQTTENKSINNNCTRKTAVKVILIFHSLKINNLNN